MAIRSNQALLQADDGPTLDAIDAILATAAERIDRTRKGRVWAAWVGGRPVHVSVTPVSVALSTGCNEPQDYDLLRRLAGAFAAKLGGVATEPETSKPTQPRQRTVTGLRFLATQCFCRTGQVKVFVRRRRASVSAIFPPALMRFLADATVEVVSWSAASGELLLRIRKEIGPESGLLRFGGVVVVHLPPRFTIAALVATHQGGDDVLFEIAEAWGESYRVVASSVEYAPDVEPVAASDGGGG